MGMNVDLTKMLDILPVVKCTRCNRTTKTRFDDYDIECGNPNPYMGRWNLDVCCEHCGYEWTINYKISSVVISTFHKMIGN